LHSTGWSSIAVTWTVLSYLLSGGHQLNLLRSVQSCPRQNFSQDNRSLEGKKDYEAYGIKYLDVFAAGCIAGFAQLSLAVPVDLVKVRLQAHQGRYRGPFDCLKQIHNEQEIEMFVFMFYINQ